MKEGKEVDQDSQKDVLNIKITFVVINFNDNLISHVTILTDLICKYLKGNQIWKENCKNLST